MLSAATAAIIGAAVGAFGTGIAAIVQSFSASRRELRARLFPEQRSTYVAFLAVIRDLQQRAASGGEGLETTAEEDRAITALEIVASEKVRELKAPIMAGLEGLIAEKKRILEEVEKGNVVPDENNRVTDEKYKAANAEFEALMDKVEDAMRRDLGNTS